MTVRTTESRHRYSTSSPLRVESAILRANATPPRSGRARRAHQNRGGAISPRQRAAAFLLLKGNRDVQEQVVADSGSRHQPMRQPDTEVVVHDEIAVDCGAVDLHRRVTREDQ